MPKSRLISPWYVSQHSHTHSYILPKLYWKHNKNWEIYCEDQQANRRTTSCKKGLHVRWSIPAVWVYSHGWSETSVCRVPRCWQTTVWSPAKLKRHLETKHAGIKNKPAEYFKRKLDGLHQQQATISVHSTLSKLCLEASYVVAKRIGKLGKPHTIAETLI